MGYNGPNEREFGGAGDSVILSRLCAGWRWKGLCFVKEYELYVPLSHNDGTPIDPAILVELRDRLRTRFGGLTYFPQRNDGFWTFGGVTYRDEIVIYRVLTENHEAARPFLRELKEELKHHLKQEEILIVEKDAGLL